MNEHTCKADNMTTNDLPRSLDVAKQATMTKWEINKLILGMRSVVKGAKIQIIRKMAKIIKNLKNRKGTEDQEKSNKNKAERLEEEIRIIKMLRSDDVSKFTLGSTEKFEEVATNPKTSLEKRALLRLATDRKLQIIVKKFRSKHSDWKEIAAFLMTLHTSRDYKKNKTTKNEEVEVNVKASETLVQTYLSAKLGHQSASDNDDDDDDNKITDKMDSKKVKSKDKTGKSVSKNKKSERIKGNVKSKSNCSDSNDNDDDERKNCDDDEDKSNSSDSDDDESSSDYDDGDDDDESENSEVSDSKSMKSAKSKGKNIDKNTEIKSSDKESREHKSGKTNKRKEDKNPTKPKTVEKIQGEMIVKKLNLDSLQEDNEIPSILLKTTSDDKPVKKKRKTKDVFFEMDSDDSDQPETDNVNNDENGEMFENDDDDDNYNDGTNGSFTGQRSFNAFTTTFVDSLNSTDMMENDSTFRTNEDWKKLRHERRDAQMGRGRGRGFQGHDRGQQSFRGQGSFRGQQSRGRGGPDSYKERGDRGRGRGDGKQTSNVSDKEKKPVSLHPSWEASKKRKEMEKNLIQPYAGKKIKFDD